MTVDHRGRQDTVGIFHPQHRSLILPPPPPGLWGRGHLRATRASLQGQGKGPTTCSSQPRRSRVDHVISRSPHTSRNTLPRFSVVYLITAAELLSRDRPAAGTPRCNARTRADARAQLHGAEANRSSNLLSRVTGCRAEPTPTLSPPSSALPVLVEDARALPPRTDAVFLLRHFWTVQRRSGQ